MELITITFTQWTKFNPRKDIKSPTWFAMSNRIAEDDQIQTLTDAEFRAFVYLLSLASQKNNPTISVHPVKAERLTGIKKSVLLNTIEKLESFQTCTRSVHERTDGVRDPNGTLQDITLQDTTRHNKTGQERESSGDASLLPPLAQIWNNHCGTLAKVKGTNASRTKKANLRFQEAEEAEWIETLAKIAKSPFCNGSNDRGWKATFDWLIQSETRLKVLEGKYDAAEIHQLRPVFEL